MTELPLVKLPHFVTVEDLSSEQVLSLIHRAEFYKDGGEMPKLTKPVYVTNAFFENSTRTHTSFEVAEKRLGLTDIFFDPSTQFSQKGRNHV